MPEFGRRRRPARPTCDGTHVDEVRFHVGAERRGADIDDVERRAQHQQLHPYDLFSRPFASPRASGSFLFAASVASNTRTDPGIELTGSICAAALALGRNERMEILGNTECATFRPR